MAGALDIYNSTVKPHGTDIVVVYNIYTQSNMFGQKYTMVNCKSLIDGETFDLQLGDLSAQLFELDIVSSIK